MSDDYAAFVARKTDPYGNAGFDPLWVPDFPGRHEERRARRPQGEAT